MSQQVLLLQVSPQFLQHFRTGDQNPIFGAYELGQLGAVQSMSILLAILSLKKCTLAAAAGQAVSSVHHPAAFLVQSPALALPPPESHSQLPFLLADSGDVGRGQDPTAPPFPDWSWVEPFPRSSSVGGLISLKKCYMW